MIISNKNISIKFFNCSKIVNDSKKQIQSSINEFVKEHKINKTNIDISFCTKKQIRALNKKFRNNDQPTNVLSFPDVEFHNVRTDCIGEIIISMDVVKEEAQRNKKKEIEHLIHLIIHSMLHLLGYKHDNENDAILMESKEIKFLSKIGISNPYK
jgi:probable rRNA maturation factor|tara:strand:+ start:5129 stop:5593 length:465 start_codon:yes stop_codon:yes gene_type:complete